MIILGIETSCDETSVSILKDGNILSNVVYSQIIHNKYGGVVPQLASIDHENHIISVTKKCFKRAKINFKDIDAIAVTYGAGLLGSLLVGLNFAKGISISTNKPLIPINHLEGHLCSNLIGKNNINFPYLSLIVSGGHTQIWIIENYNSYKMLSTTVDDAAGEAFDKGAKILGLGYPGGPEIEKLSLNGNSSKYTFTIPIVKSNRLNYSFSGIKTALLYIVRDLSDEDLIKYKSDIAASYQESIINILLNKLCKCVDEYAIRDISIVGGVSANKRFRFLASKIEKKLNLRISFPNMEYCTDNAAMIAMAGYLKCKSGIKSNIDITANPNLTL